MPVAEPKAPPKKDRGSYCDRAVKAVARTVIDYAEGTRRSGLDFMEESKARLMTTANWTKQLGPAGEEVSRQLTNVADGAGRMTGGWMKHLDRISRLPKAARQEAAYAHYLGSGKGSLTGDALKAWDEMDATFTQIMRFAQALEWERTMANGEVLPIKGSGRGYPTLLNHHGKSIVADAAKGLETHDSLDAAIRVTMLNHKPTREGLKGFTDAQKEQVVQVAKGHITPEMDANVVAAGEAIAQHAEWGFAKLRLLHDESMRGVVPYLERTRVELPKDMLNLDPVSALPGFYRRIGTMLAASREWGQDMTTWEAMLGRIQKENGPAHAELIGNYVSMQLGRPSGTVLPHTKRLLQNLRDYEMLRLFGATFIGPMRNAGQPFTNLVDMPVGALFKSLRELPPFMHRFVKEATELREMVIESGARTSENPLTEIGSGTVGSIVRPIAGIHMSVIAENEYRSAAAGYFGTIENVRRLIDFQGEKSPVARALSSLRHLSTDPEGATVRALERAGIDPDKIARIQQKAADATPEELKAMLDKPTDQLTHEDWLTAMRRTSLDTQFGYDFANRHVYSGQDPIFSILFMVKNWGVRQAGFIYQRTVKELLQGNAKPMVKLLATTFVLGELYNEVRDLATGQERSLKSRVQAGRTDAQTIALTTLRNIGDGGGLAILMDVMYGWTSLAFGPTGSTVGNLLRGAQNVQQNMEQTGTAIKDLLDKEFVITNQAKGAMNRIRAGLEEEHERFFDYGRWRDRSYQYLSDRDAPGIVAKAGETTARFLRGSSRHDPTERSLTYEQSAKAITGNDVDRAAGYMTDLLKTAEDREERESIITGLETARRQRSPIGPVPMDERSSFLSQFPPAERTAAHQLQRAWERDWTRAITKAKRDSR